MPSIRPGSLRLFRVGGIDLFLHWSWFLAAAFEISGGTKSYSSRTWNVLEYLALFLIVTLHEFGHALACRPVGLAGSDGLVVGVVLLRYSWAVGARSLLLVNWCGGGREAVALHRMAKRRRSGGFAWSPCNAAPTVGRFWMCGPCRKPFDAFQ